MSTLENRRRHRRPGWWQRLRMVWFGAAMAVSILLWVGMVWGLIVAFAMLTGCVGS